MAAAADKSFHLKLGPGAEEKRAFEGTWLVFMTSALAYKKLLKAFAILILVTINSLARDFHINHEEDRKRLLCDAILPIAFKLGKGGLARALPCLVRLATPCPTLILSLIVLLVLLAVKAFRSNVFHSHTLTLAALHMRAGFCLSDLESIIAAVEQVAARVRAPWQDRSGYGAGRDAIVRLHS